MEMKALSAIQSYTSAKPATTPVEGMEGAGAMMRNAAMDFARTLA